MTRPSVRIFHPTRWALAALLTSTAALAATSLIAPTRKQRDGAPKAGAVASSARAKQPVPPGAFLFSGAWQRTYDLQSGRTVEISVRLETPSALPANGRVAVEWTYEGKAPSAGTRPPRGGLTTQHATLNASPDASWRKVLHALDGDVYMVYRATETGRYRLKLTPVTDEAWVGDAQPRWREKGSAPKMASLPARTPWPSGFSTPVSVVVNPVDAGSRAEQERLRSIVECEPNNSAETAQPITITSGPDVETWEVTGGADDIEFFDNGLVGKSGEDWFKIEFKGSEPRLLSAQLSMPGQAVAARIQAYKRTEDGGRRTEDTSKTSSAVARLSSSLVEYRDGQDGNERVHQQDEEHRAQINRLLKPGETYYLRVEANSPGYQLQLRTVKPGPYDDPYFAIRQGMYTQIGQVDAWLTNRPRGASIERRIRDSGNLMGTNCMSCHTQSGVWGPSVPIAQGYPIENAQNYWHLINVMYECLRPTNELKDAANNTSLAPLDIGDGPAGTRAAGFNIVSAERIIAPRKLHSKMQVRTANYVLLTADPGGINAAGPGSNIGFVIVNTFSTEILKTAWEKTGDPKYFRGLEKKAKQVLAVDPKFTDDVALRLDYFGRVVPIKSFAAWAEKAKQQEIAKGLKAGAGADETAAFVEKVQAQLRDDEARLRAIQNADGSWSFSPGTSPDGGKTWKPAGDPSDPSPTALGILGLTSAGYGKEDPSIARGVKALLAAQDPTGRWNKAAQTGFVTSAYALHALARLYPVKNRVPIRQEFLPPTPRVEGRGAESLPAAIKRVRRAALSARQDCVDIFVADSRHTSALVRYWAQIGLGATHSQKGVLAIMAGVRDRSKMVRDAATWALRQTLLDDRGWKEALAAARAGDDYTREQVWQALNMRADAVMPVASFKWTQLNGLWDHAMNRDPHPAVRAWSAKAAWQWWVWNPPVRTAVNAAWVRLLERPESSALVENANRYSTQALFIVNGHKANGSKEHQYKELATLFETLDGRLEEADPEVRMRLARRLVAVGGTFFQTAGGDGGPGQMGYITSYAGDMMGNAALILLKLATEKNDLDLLKPTLEGAAGVPNRPLTEWLVSYSLKGPEDLRQLAASAISDPRVVTLAAVPEQIEPQLAQVRRGAMEPPRRPQISDPIIDLWSKVNWSVPNTEEQQRAFFDLLIPRFAAYRSPAEIAAIADAAQRAQAEKEMAAAWYLADRLGQVLEQNPDLHLEIVLFRYFPEKFSNPLEAHFWLRNVGWLLTFKGAAEKMGKALGASIERRALSIEAARPQLVSLEAGQEPARNAQSSTLNAQRSTPDPLLSIKDRVLQLYLDMLKPGSDPKTRTQAIRMANQTALRTNPEVLRALTEILPTLKDDRLKEIVENVLKQSSEKFVPDLTAALKAERHATVRFDEKGEPQLTPAQLEDILYFRDYVMPEMTRQKRQDQQSCMGCHGVPGRVPSYEMKAPDEFGYIAVADLLKDYRITQSKVNLKELERSKMLRKPLNIQDGQEDGHQGGRRYGPMDEGYLILKKWVERQPEVMKPAASLEGTRSGAVGSLPSGSFLRPQSRHFATLRTKPAFPGLPLRFTHLRQYGYRSRAGRIRHNGFFTRNGARQRGAHLWEKLETS